MYFRARKICRPAFIPTDKADEQASWNVESRIRRHKDRPIIPGVLRNLASLRTLYG